MKSEYSHSHCVSFRLVVRDNAIHILNQDIKEELSCLTTNGMNEGFYRS